MIHESLLKRMAMACRHHLRQEDCMLVFQASSVWPRAFAAYLSTNTGPFDEASFAAWALACAKRVITDQGQAS